MTVALTESGASGRSDIWDRREQFRKFGKEQWHRSHAREALCPYELFVSPSVDGPLLGLNHVWTDTGAWQFFGAVRFLLSTVRSLAHVVNARQRPGSNFRCEFMNLCLA